MKAKNLVGLLLLSGVLMSCGQPVAPESSSSEEQSSEQPSSSEISSEESSSEESSEFSSEESSEVTSEESSSSSEEGYVPYENDNVEVLMPSLYIKSHPGYNLSFKYSDSYFLEDAKTYNKDLSELSLGSSMAASYVDRGVAFFNACGFSDITANMFDGDPTVDSIGYFVAHKQIDTYELFVVSFRGFEYGSEWANNFLVGKEGDHEGFSLRAAEVVENLKTYIASHSNDRDIKIWTNGYSRAGGMANVLSSVILRDESFGVDQSNLYAYTFEAPRGLSEEHAIAYENVHNIVNSADIITYFAPAEYGLYRCGVDIDIFDSNVSTLMRSLNVGIEVPEFIPTTGTIYDYSGEEMTSEDIEITTEKQLIEYYIYRATHVNSSDETFLINTREQYVDNFETPIVNVLGLVFGLKEATRNELLAAFQEMEMWDLVVLISSPTDLVDFFATYLDKDGITYDKEALAADFEQITYIALSAFAPILQTFMGDEKDDLTRMIDMHFIETVYVLLRNMHSNVE